MAQERPTSPAPSPSPQAKSPDMMPQQASSSSSSSTTIEFSHSSVIKLSAIEPKYLATVELKELVSDLSQRRIDVTTLSREELITHRAALLDQSPPSSSSSFPIPSKGSPQMMSSEGKLLGELPSSADDKLSNRRTKDAKGVEITSLALESSEFIDPSEFPKVNWSRLTEHPAAEFATGSFSTVFYSVYKGKRVALKVFKSPRDPTELADHWKTVRKEIGILQHVARGHPNLCPIVGLTRNPLNDHPVVVMWKMQCEVKDFLAKNQSLTLQRRLRMIHELALGLLWLHDRPSPVLHLDLKLANLMLDDQEVLVICDFGLSHVMEKGRQIRIPALETKVKKGNVSHRAPELSITKAEIQFGVQVDIYSFCICAWEILSGTEWDSVIIKNELIRQGFVTRGVVDLGKAFVDAVVFRNFRPPLNSSWPGEFKELLALGWHADPNQRPPMKYIADQFRSDGPIATAFRSREKEMEKERVKSYIEMRLAHEPLATAIALSVFKDCPKVEWGTFVSGFWPIFNPYFRKTGGVIQKTDLASLMLALDVAHSPPHQTVHFEKFAKLIDAFRPLDGGFFNRIREVLEKPYVKLHWDGEKTRSKLHGATEGTFCVRYSEKKGAAFTVTKVLGDEKRSRGHQVCVRFRVYRDQEIGEESFYYRLGHRDFPRHRFTTFTEIFEGDLAPRMKLLYPQNSAWVSPFTKLTLPPVSDSGPMTSSSQERDTWADTKQPLESYYMYIPDHIYETCSDPTDALRRLGDRGMMSPDRADLSD